MEPALQLAAARAAVQAARVAGQAATEVAGEGTGRAVAWLLAPGQATQQGEGWERGRGVAPLGVG